MQMANLSSQEQCLKQQEQQGSEIKQLITTATKVRKQIRRCQVKNEKQITLHDLAKKYMDGIVIPCLTRAVKRGITSITITMFRKDFLNVHINMVPPVVVKLMIEEWIKSHPIYEGLYFIVFNNENENFITRFWLKKPS